MRKCALIGTEHIIKNAKSEKRSGVAESGKRCSVAESSISIAVANLLSAGSGVRSARSDRRPRELFLERLGSDDGER